MLDNITFSNSMNTYPIYADLHTHSISSGHGSCDTITDMLKAASDRMVRPVLVPPKPPIFKV